MFGRPVVDSPRAQSFALTPDGGAGDNGDPDPEAFLCRVTRQDAIDDAIDWLADGLPLQEHCDPRSLIRAVARTSDRSARREAALRRLARELTTSSIDSAEFLFGIQELPPPSRYSESLHALATRCPSRGLDSISASVVIEAQRDDPFVIAALCAVAGISYKDLTGRIDGTTGRSDVVPMSPAQLRAAFAIIDAAVRGTGVALLEGALPAQPLELLPALEGTAGWAEVERLRLGGVPYGVMLAQRAFGGAWLAHRNRTSGNIPALLAGKLCAELEARGVGHLRSTAVGGDTSPSALARLTEADKQVGVIVLDAAANPVFAVIFSAARDHGTARASAGRLLAMERRKRELPIAVCIAGPGWAKRHETADLAVGFDGYLYSDESLDELVNEIARHVSVGEEGSDPWP